MAAPNIHQTTAGKVCPKCLTPAHIDATSCARCGHQFRTQFANQNPNQTQMYGIPAAQQPFQQPPPPSGYAPPGYQPAPNAIAGYGSNRAAWLWWKWKRRVVGVALLLALLFGAWIAYARFMPPPFVGTWMTSRGNGSQGLTFGKDQTGTMFWSNDGAGRSTAFTWKRDGNFLLLVMPDDAPAVGMVEGESAPTTRRVIPATWTVSDGGNVLTVTIDSQTTMYSRQGG